MFKFQSQLFKRMKVAASRRGIRSKLVVKAIQHDLDQILIRGVVEVIDRNHLSKSLKSGRQMRVKLGVDPTDSSLHLGHVVALRKLRQFQRLGHLAVIIIGDWTAQIGDPSGKDKTRPVLTHRQVSANAKFYEKQIKRFLDTDLVEFRWQSQWFKKLSLPSFFELLGKVSAHELLGHETFKNRLATGLPLATHELMYPILQGYDSVAVQADIELGASEQKFNLLMGRQIQRVFGQPEQDVLMVPYLTGTDGQQKMSKSLGNTISLLDLPEDVYGKVMSIPDHLIIEYFTLCTDLTDKALEVVKKEVGTRPRDAKARLAFLITQNLFDEPSAEQAQEQFELVFRHKQAPDSIPEVKINRGMKLIEIVLMSRLAPSKAEARRLIEQGGVRINGQTGREWDKKISIPDGMILQVGKRKFVRLKVD